jgi:isopenicillin-N epimerase
VADWKWVREQFLLADDEINLAGLGIAPHPAPVRKAIDDVRNGFDRRPWTYFLDNFNAQEKLQREAVAAYLKVSSRNVALTDGTTQGLSLLYAGLTIDPGGEILTGDREFSYVYEIFDARRKRHGTIARRIPLFKSPRCASTAEILDAIKNGICTHTRVLALTWVYSNTGVKLPIAKIAGLVDGINASREPDERILFCVDGVHGLGTEPETFPELNCDFFVAGCHKSVFGPRGTGIWCGKEEAWSRCDRLNPTSTTSTAGPGAIMAPGGVHSYEHRWALKSALEFLDGITMKEVSDRVHQLAGILKTELGTIGHIVRVTPDSDELSSGIVCFDIEGKDPAQVVKDLRKLGIIATTSSSDASAPGVRHVRFSVEIFNSELEIETALKAVATLVPC